MEEEDGNAVAAEDIAEDEDNSAEDVLEGPELADKEEEASSLTSTPILPPVSIDSSVRNALDGREMVNSEKANLVVGVGEVVRDLASNSASSKKGRGEVSSAIIRARCSC